MIGLAQRPWPSLREDLTLHAGPSDRDGAPTWTVHDPARNQYFSLDWVAFEVVSRLSLGSLEAVCESVNRETTLHLESEDVQAVLQFLERNELVHRADLQGAAELSRKQALTQTGWTQKLLHGYLFFRIPLFRPDAWLGRLLPHLNFFFSAYFLKLSALVPDVRLQVVSIDRNAISVLPDAALATTSGGQVTVRVQGNKLYPERTLYRVRLKAISLHEKLSTGHLRGRVVILGWPKSLMGDLVGHALATLIREAGF